MFLSLFYQIIQNQNSMKKIILCLAIIVSIKAYSQTEKGTWLLGGSASFSSSKQPYGDAITILSITPNIGYFIKKDLAVGAQASLQNITNNNTATSFSPFIRYYFLPLGSNAKLFVNGSYGWGSYLLNGNSTGLSTWEIAAGPSIFLNRNIALELTLAYAKGDLTGYGTTGTIRFNTGFQIHLNKKGKK